VASVLTLIIDVLVSLALALRLGDTTTPVTLVTSLVTSVLLTLWNSLVAPVGDMPLLLLGSVIVVPARHWDLSC
jgi:hypothetical protein